MKIEFLDRDPPYDIDRDSLILRAVTDAGRVQCFVTAELLGHRFGGRGFTEEDLREPFNRHRDEILALARLHIESGWVDSEGIAFLTKRATAATVSFKDDGIGWPNGMHLMQTAHKVLLEIIGPNAGEVEIEWRFKEEIKDNRATIVRVKMFDPAIHHGATTFLTAKELDDRSQLSFALARAWGILLRERDRVLSLKYG